MTGEKAIEALSLLRIFDAPDLNEAVKMAVAALRYQANTLPNDPLTLEELRKMYGEPVWIVSTSGEYNPCWGLINGLDKRVYDANFGFCPFHEYGKTWLAYRHKPEEGKT